MFFDQHYWGRVEEEGREGVNVFSGEKIIQGILFNTFWNSTEKANQINWIPRSLLKDTTVHGILIT